MSLTRDDMLRELELLPAWKLRAPVETGLTAETKTREIEKVEVEKVEAVQVATANCEKPVHEKPSSAAPRQYEITLSQDKHWAFANEMITSELSLPAGRMAIGLDVGDLQGKLFNNILHALCIEKPTKIYAQNLTNYNLANIDAKIIVAMGESVAQTLLNSQEKLESLRGKLHTLGDAQLLVTYDIAHLLSKPLDKAKIWQALCLARSYLQSLQSQD